MTCFVTSADREVKEFAHWAQDCFKVASGGPEVASKYEEDF